MSRPLVLTSVHVVYCSLSVVRSCCCCVLSPYFAAAPGGPHGTARKNWQTFLYGVAEHGSLSGTFNNGLSLPLGSLPE